MKVQVFSVYDNVAQVYAQPMIFHNVDVARRSFLNAVLTKDSKFAQNPTDFELRLIGEWDDYTGHICSCEPVLIVRAVDALTLKKATVENEPQHSASETVADAQKGE